MVAETVYTGLELADAWLALNDIVSDCVCAAFPIPESDGDVVFIKVEALDV